jgi:hypothetical protein
MGIAAAVLMSACNGGSCRGSAAKPAEPAAKFRTMDTAAFTLQVPSGWVVSEETPWGARDIRPEKSGEMGGASMSSMTGPGLGRSSWDRLYDTSLYFITRGEKAGALKASPYEVGRSPKGFEMCSWTMSDARGNTVQRHAILKHTNGNILALSAKTPPAASAADASKLNGMFRHMLETAVVK